MSQKRICRDSIKQWYLSISFLSLKLMIYNKFDNQFFEEFLYKKPYDELDFTIIALFYNRFVKLMVK